jgi:hypothetical protein
MVEFFFLALITTPSMRPSALEVTTPCIAGSEEVCAFREREKILKKSKK